MEKKYCKLCNHRGVEVEPSGYCRFCEKDLKKPEYVKNAERKYDVFTQEWKQENGRYCYRVSKREGLYANNYCGLVSLDEESFNEIDKNCNVNI